MNTGQRRRGDKGASSRLVIAVAAVAMSGFACGGTPVASGPVASMPVLVSLDKTITHTLEGPDLLVDRSNPSTVYLSDAELQTGECRFFSSTDRGTTWAKGGSPNLSPYSCSPGTGHPQSIRTHLAQASDGSLYYVFAGNDPSAGGARSVLLGHSNDRGQTWKTSIVVKGPPVAAATFGDAQLNYQAHVAIDPSDAKRVIVAWRRAYPNFQGKVKFPNRSWMAASTDGGATFGDPFMFLDEDTSGDSPQLFFANGKLNATYVQAFPRPPTGDAPPNKLHFASSSDGGRTWSESDLSTPAPFADGPTALWDVAHKQFVAVWDDNRNGEFDVFATTSSDGKTWSPTLKVNDDPKRIKGHLFPTLGRSPDGRLDVSWYDFRNDPYPAETGLRAGNQGKRSDVYSSHSIDGGRTWTPNLKINDIPIDRTKGIQNAQFSFFVPLAMASSGTWSMTAWSDTRNGDGFSSTQDIYTARVDYHVQPAGPGGGDLGLATALAASGGLAAGAGVALLVTVLLIRRRRSNPGEPSGA